MNDRTICSRQKKTTRNYPVRVLVQLVVGFGLMLSSVAFACRHHEGCTRLSVLGISWVSDAASDAGLLPTPDEPGDERF